MSGRLYRCTACGTEVARRAEHPESACRPALRMSPSTHLEQLQRRVDEIVEELGEQAREAVS
jgi:hypothetical protein